MADHWVTCTHCGLEVNIQEPGAAHNQGFRSGEWMHTECCQRGGACSPEAIERLLRDFRQETEGPYFDPDEEDID